MKKIYCVYCGKQNKIDNKVCSNCKKELNPKEHLWKDYIIDHIKDNLKSNIEDNIFSYLTNFIKSHLYGVLLSLVVVSSATSLVVQNINSSYIEEVRDKPTSVSKENIDVNSTLIENLYSYLDFNEDGYIDVVCNNCKIDFYSNKNITYDDLTDAIRLYIAYSNASLNPTDVYYTSCEDIKEYTETYNYCIQNEDYVIGSSTLPGTYEFYTIDNESLVNTYHNIFGLDKELPKGIYRMAETRKCEASSITGEYLCYQLAEGYMDVNYEYTKIISATKYGNYIYIYDYFIYIANDLNSGTYKDKLRNEKISEKSDEDLVTSGQIYEHTFKLDSNGNYYWIQSKPVDEIKIKAT